MRSYDYVFVTHLPAFYKVNLYREIAKSCRVLVIFIAQGSSIRTPDFLGDLNDLEHIVLNEGPFEHRSILKSAWQLMQVMRRITYHTIVVGGWDLPEYWMLAYWPSCRPRTVALALESSIHDSLYRGWRGMTKRFFLRKIKNVFASGTPHKALLEALCYQGTILTTMGVGIFHYSEKETDKSVFNGRFLYVGRLSEEKNLTRLIAIFRQLPHFTLTIVGTGKLVHALKQDCPPNVFFKGHVDNKQLSACYQAHDIFILPSLHEPWGLVVEEALYHGLPVVASNRVGCALDLIESYKVGALFDPCDSHAMEEAILWVAARYSILCDQIKRIDFTVRDHLQVQQYLEALG